MRTTIRIDDRLFTEIKQRAARTHQTIAAVIEEALRESLHRRETCVKRKPVRLPTLNGTGLQPGVDLDDTSSLFDLMDGIK